MEAKKFMVAFFMVALLAPMIPLSLAATALTVQTNSKFYNRGEEVTITGTATASASVKIELKHGETTIPDSTIIADNAGAYTKNYAIYYSRTWYMDCYSNFRN